MSLIRELKASASKKLEALEYQALALEAQLTQTKDQVIERLEQHKHQLRDTLRQLQADLQKSKGVAEEAKAEVEAKVDHLQVQLALGKAEARDVVEEQRAKILNALAALESTAEQKLTTAGYGAGKVWEDLVGKASALEAEFDALRTRFELEKERQKVKLEDRTQELLDKIQAFKDDLKAKRQMVQAKADTFEQDLRDGLEQIKTAFRRLFE